VLREHLVLHDGAPVLARDAVARIRRWALSDPLGALLMANTDELSAPDGRTIRFRRKPPFPLLLLALGKTQPPMLAIMPERLTKTPITASVPEAIGSGPFRFNTGDCCRGRITAATWTASSPTALTPTAIRPARAPWVTATPRWSTTNCGCMA
jgi:peptide/nickel transport system substrate-binding protein